MRFPTHITVWQDFEKSCRAALGQDQSSRYRVSVFPAFFLLVLFHPCDKRNTLIRLHSAPGGRYACGESLILNGLDVLLSLPPPPDASYSLILNW